MAEITALLAQIEESNEKIKQLKGVTKCENCGADVPVDAAFCNNCGTKVVKPVAAPAVEAASVSDQRLCPTCGQPVGKDNMFCNNCGAKL
jgi:predicted amidophosphoribosyltransferase